ncbi:MAG: hypothetical protein JSS40_13950 [Proteobacteria bacterium]|nr:hypothetical protein [Pseudomonadota bacterium]
MNKHFSFFVGLLFPVFIMVALVRVVMNDMVVMKSIWSWWTLVFTFAGALAGTILQVTMQPKAKKKVGEK